jgi:hypothetical protein
VGLWKLRKGGTVRLQCVKNKLSLQNKVFTITLCLGIIGQFLGIISAIPNREVFVVIILLMMVSSNYVSCSLGLSTNKKWIINALAICENGRDTFKSDEAINIFSSKITIVIMVYLILRNFIGISFIFMASSVVLLFVHLTSFMLTTLIGVYVYLIDLVDRCLSSNDKLTDVQLEVDVLFNKIINLKRLNNVLSRIYIAFAFLLVLISIFFCPISFDISIGLFSFNSNFLMVCILFVIIFYYNITKSLVLDKLLLSKVVLGNTPLYGENSKETFSLIRQLLMFQLFSKKFIFVFLPFIYWLSFCFLVNAITK